MPIGGGDGKEWERDGDPAWDADFANDLVGSTVLIGLTVMDRNGRLSEERQLHGVVVSVDRKNGFEIKLAGARAGETYWLPPDLSSFKSADPGEYRLRSTGEVILDPDYLSTWTITKAD